MESLQLPDHIHNWLVRYFESRGHVTRLGDIISTIAFTNASIVQVSDVGPSSYVIVASDLRLRHSENRMMKYADDTYVLVGSAMVHTVTDEFNNIQSWAAKNNLKIHPSKTKEIIFSWRRSKVQYPSDPFIPGAERVDALRVLGVILAPHLSMGAHLDRMIANCASSRFALRTLRAHGLPPPELHLVTRMTTVSSLMYASPSWWGFTDTSDRSRFERQLPSLRRAGFLPPDFPSFDELARNADAGLFRSICSNPDHVLRHYFTDKSPTGHDLRPRAHSFALPSKDPRNFVSRILYRALLNRD